MKQKMLVIVVGENDRHEDMPLYEAVTRKLIQLGTPEPRFSVESWASAAIKNGCIISSCSALRTIVR